jgi:hypothetical protein
MTEVTIRRWQDHTTWLTVSTPGTGAIDAIATELGRARSGATALIDLTDAGTFGAAFAAGLRDAVELAVQQGVHVVVAASDLEARLALVGVDLEHLAPMPQSRRDAMAFLSSVIAQAS